MTILLNLSSNGIATATVKVDKVMLIDDNEIDNFVNTEILNTCNFCNTIISHDDPHVAISQLSRLGEGDEENIPDIIFLDINMPLMNGFEFLIEFDKLSQAIKNKTKIVILTSSLNHSDLNSAMENNFVLDYIEKPLTEESLNRVGSKID